MGLFDINCEKYNSKSIIKIGISSGIEKPYYLKKKGLVSNGCFIRVGNATEQLSQKNIEELFSGKNRPSLCKIVSPKQDLKFSQLKIYYSEKRF